ncbi:sugar phosphate nucleotidyltransferase [Halococcus sp. IIIV-5B]|uniref:sugar phosphate nucleotidyltransferase n=1 Tax=Halococcus sp. IIIV-5B TaxID=2321230 RepID=UPI000E72900A|nr:sugar phosphate nucleotidyltransferase [Halococcus sp. IIIV-5B]RJS97458.1 spore coat protein [Halococcus sp. IIIV-5B]
MKGIVLAGGRGTRLRPITRVINKHILPVYDKPVIYYPVQTLIDAGINEILIVSDSDYIGKYMELLELDFNADFSYRIQSEPGGIAQAISLADEFVGDDSFAVMLGDNLLFGDIESAIQEFEHQDSGAKIFLKEVDEPTAYGIATVQDSKVTKLIEKPSSPVSNSAVIGLYLYQSDAFDKISELEPSERGEYEVTDLNRSYISDGTLTYDYFDGEWFDTGTPEGLFQAAEHVRNQEDGSPQ